jgi:LysM repeat protein
MNTKKLTQLIVITALLVTSFVSTGSALAWSQCPTYITVQAGDTLSGVAALCNTTVDAIRAVNPGLGWWLYTGQVINIPTGSTPSYPQTGGTYVVQTGDTLGKIAARGKTSVNAILAFNPQISNASLIYAGQVINLPAGVTLEPSKPPKPTPPPSTPPPSNNGWDKLKIVYEKGMYVRTGPDGKIISSALYKDVLWYDTNSVYVDGKWRVWVIVKLIKPTKDYTTGWLMIRDQYGTYFVSPQIDP